MKTISYNTEKEFRVGIMIVVIILAIFATIKVRELQLNDVNFAEAIRTGGMEIRSTDFPSFTAADAKLIEEPLLAAERLVATNEASAIEHKLAIQMRTWVNSSAYWSDENAENEKELALQMTSWLKNKTCWNDEETDNETELAQQMTTWMKNGSLFNALKAEDLPAANYEKQPAKTDNENINPATPDKELVTQMKSWISKAEYWEIASN